MAALMALLICSATTKELAALAPSLFPRPHSMPEMQPMRGNVKNGKAIFLATGVGPVNAALGMGLALGLTHKSTGSDVHIDGIIYAGLAGAFHLERNPLRSIWRVSEEIWPEYGLHDGTRVTARAFSHALWERKDQDDIFERIPLADFAAIPHIEHKKAEEWPACASLTVAGVSASFVRRDALWDLYHVDLENMEGFAAAYAAARAEIPMVEIRVISNKVGPRSRAEKDFDGALETLGEILPALNIL